MSNVARAACLEVVIRKWSLLVIWDSEAVLGSVENLEYLGGHRIRGLRSLLDNNLDRENS